MKNNKLLKNGLLYTVGGLLIQGVNFFTLPIFTRLLSVESFGIVSIYNTWLSILAIFICFQSHGSIGNARINYSEEEFEKYTSNIVLLSSVIFIFWIMIFILFKEKIGVLLNLSVYMIFIMLIQSFFNTIITLKSTIYIFEEKAKQKLIISFLNIIFNVIFSIIFIKYVYEEKTYFGRIIGGAVPTIALGIYFYIDVARKKIPRINLEHWKFCLTLTIPIIFHGLSGVVLGSSDRVMLQKYKGFYETGLYSLVYNFGMIISMIWGALNSAWVPWYYDNMKKENHDSIRNYSKNYLYLFTTLYVGFLMLSPEVLKIMAPEKYWSSIGFLPLIVGGYYFNYLYSFSVNYEFYSKKTKYIAIATTGAAGVNFLLNLYFIPKYGGAGAASTTLISYLAMFLFHEGLVRVKFNYSILKKMEYLKEIILILIFSSIYYLYLDNLFMRLTFLFIYIIIRGIYFYKINKNLGG
ncbi:MAG: oligosaccharide flippase family protein [Cetobacterium sp.]